MKTMPSLILVKFPRHVSDMDHLQGVLFIACCRVTESRYTRQQTYPYKCVRITLLWVICDTVCFDLHMSSSVVFKMEIQQ
jgi:hypothetical protein